MGLSVPFELLFLLLEVFLGDWLLAERARVVRLQPIRNALAVEKVPAVARQRDYLVLGSVLHHANNALCTLGVFFRLELSLEHIF